ncbi:CPBP family intramembrane glutamic endopeptidase [Luteimonas kalidii]|uniref:CPBP family intramembrane metalloprotease n=1 Tax=Luteimonas kalidii TaxID=3042025 RepID=A0ABT6JT95_9GAMM|nr:CPBP family intramembrane metalloprotease [Luteimonas kalidii]MDH5833822.1 CPBP family intramembrane metalloprotease [Luteimonas kalidii]
MDHRSITAMVPLMSPTVVLLRLVLLVAGMLLVWRTTLSVLPYEAGRNASVHMTAGVLISAGVLGLLVVLKRLDGLSWREMGSGGAHRNLRAFALGAGLWLLPAAAGTALCIALGWSTLDLRSPGAHVAWTLPALALGVFLVEALPEELAVRGYAQGLAVRALPPWASLLLQVVVFTAFAWGVGALGSVQQWLFIPALALILGYARALTGSTWTGIGVHTAWMTSQQWLAANAEAQGMQTLQFVAFALLPSATLGAVLGMRHPEFDWRRAMRRP